MTKTTKIVLAVAAVLIIAGVAYWYWGVYSPKKKVTEEKDPTKQTVATPSKETTSNQ